MSSNDSSPGWTNWTDVKVSIPRGVTLAGSALGILLVSSGILGNILLFLSVVVYKKLRTAPNAFIGSLALADVFILCTYYSINIHVYVTGGWNLGAQICLFHIILLTCMKTCGLMHITGITFYRYTLIVRPNWHIHMVKTWVVTLLLSIFYILPLLMTLGSQIKFIIGGYQLGIDVFFDFPNLICYKANEGNIMIPILAALGIFLSVLIYMYVAVFLVVKRSADKFKKDTTKQGAKEETKQRKEIKLVKTIIVILGIFVITFILHPVVYAVEKRVGSLPHAFHLIVNLLDVSSSATRWLVYGLMNQQFRVAYIGLLRCGRSKNTVLDNSTVITVKE